MIQTYRGRYDWPEASLIRIARGVGCLLLAGESRRLYVSHTSEVGIIDLDSQKVLGKIPVDGVSHGNALVNDPKFGFITDRDSKTSTAKTEQVVAIDLRTFARKAKITVGDDPDAIVYDGPSGPSSCFQRRSHARPGD